MRRRFVGSSPRDLASGQMMAPGGFYELTDEQERDPHNKRMIDDGLLIDAPEDVKPKGKTPDNNLQS